MSQAVLQRVTQALARARRDDLLRVQDVREGPQGAHVRLDGTDLVNFTSNDYLGLAADPRVVERVTATLPKQGFGSGAAALLSGRSSTHAELERALAALTGQPAALLFSSGYLANLGSLVALAGRGDFIAHDRLNHASLIDGVLASRARHRRYPHADLDSAADLLRDAATTARFLVSESVYSMDGDEVDVTALARIARDHDALLYVDDAHGFGVNGVDGRGAGPQLAAAAASSLLMVTFGKALGTAGAAVLGPAELIDFLVQRARTFVYDTALPAVCAEAALAALDILRTDPGPRARLAANIAHFRARARAAGLPLLPSTTPIQPLVVGSAARALALAAHVRAAGYYVRAIRPPTVPEGTARLRITLSAKHDDAMIDGLVDTLASGLPA